MPPTSVNTMPGHTSVLNPSSITATDTISLREFVADEDAENLSAALWRTIDQNAFILAQRDALEAFNVAKALRLSKETAAAELERRQAATVPANTAETQQLSGRHQRHASQAIEIKKAGATLSDEAIARSLARSWQVDVIQPAILENRSSSSAKPIKISPSSSYLDKTRVPPSIAIQNSRNQLSLSTPSFPTTSSYSTSRHSRSTSQSNTVTKVPSLFLPSDQRNLTKTDDPILSSSHSQTLDAIHPKRRHTECKPSVSSPSLDVVVTAPPLSEPQKSSMFSRNLRLRPR